MPRDAAMLAKRAFSAGEGRVVIEGSVDAGARVFTAGVLQTDSEGPGTDFSMNAFSR